MVLRKCVSVNVLFDEGNRLEWRLAHFLFLPQFTLGYSSKWHRLLYLVRILNLNSITTCLAPARTQYHLVSTTAAAAVATHRGEHKQYFHHHPTDKKRRLRRLWSTNKFTDRIFIWDHSSSLSSNNLVRPNFHPYQNTMIKANGDQTNHQLGQVLYQWWAVGDRVYYDEDVDDRSGDVAYRGGTWWNYFFSNESRWQLWCFRVRLSHTSSQTPLTSPYQTKGRDGENGFVCEKFSNNLCNCNFSNRYLCCDPSSQQTVSYENINMDHISGELNTSWRKKCPFIKIKIWIKIKDLPILQDYSIMDNEHETFCSYDNNQVSAMRASTSRQW